MTKSEYIEAGYRLSLQVDERLLRRAETAVVAAYAERIGGTYYDENCSEWRACVMACAFVWVMQHSAIATKAGAKSVQLTSAESVSDYEVLRQAAMDAAVSVADFRAKVASDYAEQGDEARPDGSGQVQDVCRIYFETNFFGLN